MIKKVTITNHLGEVLTLDLKNPEQSGFFIKNITGLSASKTTINMSESLGQDGGIYNSSRVGTRNLVLTLGFYSGQSLYSIETLRQQTYRFFPLKRLVRVEIETDNRIGYTTGYVETNEADIFSSEESAQISLICMNPFFLATDTEVVVFSGVDPTFEFPWENPSLVSAQIEFGQVFVNTQQSVFYTGDEETGVTVYISINGTVINLSVHNATAGQTIDIDTVKLVNLTGSGFVAGDFVIITTQKGNKNVWLIRNGVWWNLLNALGEHVDWFTIDRGDNVFTYTATSGVNKMLFSIEYQLVYQGM